MIWFVISIILLLFSAAVTGVALSNNVKGAGIGLIPGLVGLLLLIPACLYSVDVGEVAVWAFVECPVVFVALFEEAGE